MTPGVRHGAAAVAGVLGAVLLVAGLHADAVAYLSARGALHRAAVAGLRAVGPEGRPPAGVPRSDVPLEATVDAVARAAWSTEPTVARAHDAPRFVVRLSQQDGWPVVDVEAAVVPDLPFGLAFWLAEGPVVRVRGAGRP